MIWLVAVLLTNPAHDAGSRVPIDASTVTARNTAADVLGSDARRVRCTNGRMARLLLEGARRSPTFAELILNVQRSNVIVYVEPSFGLPAGLTGRILLQGVGGGQRYLRVQVRATLPAHQIIGVIAHELRHALEVAEHPAVVDEPTLLALYRRIGHISYGVNGYDTDAANVIARKVRDELLS